MEHYKKINDEMLVEDKTKFDNELLVEFEFIIDLDLAMYKYIRSNFSSSPYVDKEFINEKDEKAVIYKLLNRKHINPLEIILPGHETTEMYFEIMNKHYEELLSYAKAYDTFGLMITFLGNASSVSIDILCKSELEASFIKQLNPNLNTIVKQNKANVLLNKYTALYVKYLANLFEYDIDSIIGKHIYFSAAKYNMEEDKDMISEICWVFADVNIFHLIDLYTMVKYRYERKEDEEDDNLF